MKNVICARKILGTVPKNHQFFGNFWDCPEFHEHETNYNLSNKKEGEYNKKR